jgi:hypothetical protein
MSSPAPLVLKRRLFDRIESVTVAPGLNTEPRQQIGSGVTTYHPGDAAGAQSISQTVSLGAILEY